MSLKSSVHLEKRSVNQCRDRDLTTAESRDSKDLYGTYDKILDSI